MWIIYFVSINFLFNIIFNHARQLSDGINKDIKVDIDSLKYTPCLEIMTGFVSKCDNLIALKLLWWFASTGRSPFIEYSSHTQNIKGNCNWLSLSYIEGYYKTISALFLWLFFYQYASINLYQCLAAFKRKFLIILYKIKIITKQSCHRTY